MSTKRGITGLETTAASDRFAEERTDPADGPVDFVTAQPSNPTKIGRFTFLEPIGSGAMGIVCAGYDPRLDRKVAIKLLAARHDTERRRQRMVREAQAMAKLAHPHVVTVFEVGEYQGQVFVAMEFVKGGNLRQWLETERSWQEVVDVYTQAGRGLAAAHQVGIVHRDFKPDNVFIGDDGRVRVGDFGLAHQGALTESQPANAAGMPQQALTQTGALMGTPAYMAPEQFAGKSTDSRTDQFAFCVSFWEALYGVRPFAGTTFIELADSVESATFTPLPKGTGVPLRVHQVLLRGLSSDPADRYPTMELFLERLAAAVNFRRKIVIAASVIFAFVAVIAAIAVAVMDDVDTLAQSCVDAGSLDDVWSPAIAKSIGQAIDEVGVSYGAATWATVQPRLEKYSAALSAAMVDACITREGHRGTLPPALGEQLECLERRRLELRAVIEQFQSPDVKTIENAVAIASGLPALDRCNDLDDLAGEALRRRKSGYAGDPQDPEWTAIEALLVDARVAIRGERLEQAEALASEALTAAEALGARPLRAGALFRLGTVAQLRGKYEEARKHLRTALFEAEAVGDDRLVLEIVLGFLRVDGIVNTDASAARSWGLLAEAKIGFVGEPEYKIELDLKRGVVFYETGEWESAEAAVSAAVALAAEHREAYPELYVSALNILSTVEKARGDLTTSEKTLRKALAEHIEIFGAGHPYQAVLIYNIGAVQLMRNELQGARDSFAKSLAAREATYGPDHPEVAQSLNGLAAALLDLGDAEAAIPLIQRSLAIDEKARGMEDAELIFPLNNLADALTAEERFAEAEPHLVRALAILKKRDLMETSRAVLILTGLADLDLADERFDEGLARLDKAAIIGRKVMGDSHPTLAEIRFQRALLLLGKGEREAAEALLDKALAQVAGKGDFIGLQTRIKLKTAELMWDKRNRRPAAIALVEGAAEAFRASAANDPGLVRELDSWLAKHR